MQKENTHWYLNTSPISVVLKSSWLLIPAIITLLAYDVFESSLIAAHGDNSLILFGFLMPIITLLSAISIAVAVRTNMELVRKHGASASLIPSLLAFSMFIGVVLIGLLFFTKDAYLSLLDAKTWLSQFDSKLQTHYASELNSFLNYKFFSLLSLMLVWQLSSVFRVIGQCKLSALYLFGWMAFKTLWLSVNIDAQSLGLISNIAKMHFYIDTGFALFGAFLLVCVTKLDFSHLSFTSVMQQKRRSLLLTLQQLAPAVSLTILTAMVSRFDEGYVAAFALLFRIEAFLLLLPMIFTASLPTVIGICYWAGDRVRCRNVLQIAFLSIVIAQLVIAVAVFYWQNTVIATLCPDCFQKQVITQYLNLLPFSYVFLGIALLVPSCLNAIGDVAKASLLIVLHRLLLVPLFAGVGLISGNAFGLFIGLFVAHFSICLYLIWQYRKALINSVSQSGINSGVLKVV